MKRSPMKKTNPKRKAASFDRAYGGAERVEWVKAQPCWICAKTPSENAHCRTGGTGRKADACYILPLCSFHHSVLHGKGKRSFEECYLIDLDYGAAITDARWEQYSASLQEPTP